MYSNNMKSSKYTNNQVTSYTLEYAENQTNEICLAAVKNNGYTLEYVKKQTDTHGDVFSLIQETTRLNDLYVSIFKDDSSELINYAT